MGEGEGEGEVDTDLSRKETRNDIAREWTNFAARTIDNWQFGNTRRKPWDISWRKPRDTKLRSVCVIREDPVASFEWLRVSRCRARGHPFSCGGNNKPRAVITRRDLTASSWPAARGWSSLKKERERRGVGVAAMKSQADNAASLII
jgi:hypothetical protein